MPTEILPFDFNWRLTVRTTNAIPTSIHFMVRKRHDIGSTTVNIDLVAQNRRLRSIVDELVIQRGAKIEGALSIHAENSRGLEMILEQDLAQRFVSLMHAGCDSRCDEARRILLNALEPYLDAAEMQGLTDEVAV